MKKIKVQELSVEKFHRYGSYGTMLNPDTDATGPKDAPIVFFRDMVVPRMFNGAPSFSVCRMTARKPIINVGEYHNDTAEIAMPLDADTVIWVAPADCGTEVPVDKIEAFRIPRGTAFALNPGVWHHAAYCIEGEALNVLIVLPERAYAKDCVAMEIPQEKQLEIEL